MQNVWPQMYLGGYGIRVNSTNSVVSPDAGKGFASSFLSKGDSLGDKRNAFPIVVQFGGNFFYSGLGQRTFYGVPLLVPQVGEAKVKLSNSMFLINAVARFSFPGKTIFTPYIDVFAGYRATYTMLHIYPYLQYGTQ